VPYAAVLVAQRATNKAEGHGRDAKQAAEAVRRRILADVDRGRLVPGEKLGSERELCERFGVTRSTLRLALDALERAGVVDRVSGRAGGTFVRQSKVERDLSRIAGLPEHLRRQGVVAGTRVLSASMKDADAVIARALEIPPGAPVYDILRLRLADGEPISLEHAMLPAERLPGLLDEPLGGSLTELLDERYGVKPAEAVERIEVTRAARDEAQVLGIAPGASLISVERVASTADGRPCEFSLDLFRGDRTRMVVKTSGSAREVSPSDTGHGLEVRSF
jgi:GntR family transcriptional regulator